MTFYIWLIVLTELLMFAMALHVLNYSGFTKIQRMWFLLTFLSISLCAGAEFAVHSGLFSPSKVLPLTVVTVVQFSLAPMLGILFSGALGLHRQKRVACVFFLVNLLVETAAAPFGWIFYFSPEGYSRGEYFIIYEGFYLISLVYLLVSLFTVGKHFRRRDTWTIIMLMAILVAGILPMTLYQLNVTYAAIAVGACLSYIYYNDLVQQDIKEELISNQEKISDMQKHIISGMANLIESRDMETGQHISRTSAYARTLAEQARNDGLYVQELDDHFISLLHMLAPMHDIGKILVPDSILKKPGKLTEEEFEQMKLHASNGGALVRQVLSGVTDEEYLSFASDIVTYHHERWDGKGYPQGLKGEEIPLSARIMAFADVFDALISQRCYKKAMSRQEAFDIIRQEAGTHFDPRLAEVFLRHKELF